MSPSLAGLAQKWTCRRHRSIRYSCAAAPWTWQAPWVHSHLSRCAAKGKALQVPSCPPAALEVLSLGDQSEVERVTGSPSPGLLPPRGHTMPDHTLELGMVLSQSSGPGHGEGNDVATSRTGPRSHPVCLFPSRGRDGHSQNWETLTSVWLCGAARHMPCHQPGCCALLHSRPLWQERPRLMNSEAFGSDPSSPFSAMEYWGPNLSVYVSPL